MQRQPLAQRKLTPAAQTDYDRKKTFLQRINIIAWLFHWTSATVATAIIFGVVKSTYSASLDFSSQQEVGDAFVSTTDHLGDYPLAIPLLIVPWLTGVFHFVLGLVPPVRQYYERVALNEGRDGAGANYIRWLEYSLSASLVTWNTAQASGGSDVGALIMLVALNVMMQLCGAAHEWANRGWTPARRRWPNMWFFVAGFVPFIASWIYIWWVFIRAASSAGGALPAFVWALVIGIFVQYCLFVVPILLRYNPWWQLSNYWYENAYIALSFTSKAYLDWTLIGAALTR
jgi:hypothetical protein